VKAFLILRYFFTFFFVITIKTMIGYIVALIALSY